MDANVVLKNRAAAILLAEILSDSELAAALAVYFSPYCDCNITDWIVGRLNANDAFVIAKIRELIAARDDFPLIRGTYKPVQGQLLSQYCSGNDFIGIYADGNGGEVQKTIEADSINQGCKQPESVQFFYPLSTQASLVNDGADGVIFSNYPKDEDPVNQVIRLQKIFASSPRTPRLQIKLGGLESQQYDQLSVHIFSQYDENGISQGPQGKIPYNTQWQDWDGSVTAVYDSSTRVVKVQAQYLQQMAGFVYITILKGTQIVGWTNLYSGHYTTDPTTGQPSVYNTFIMNNGS
jgi:hypothetical protein